MYVPYHVIKMGAPKKLFLSHILTTLVGLSIAQPRFIYHFCIDSGNFTTNSAYHENLNTLLSSLSSNTNSYGFYNSSVGQNSDKVNAIALCRGDVELQTCRSCIDNSTRKLTELCPNNKEAIGWHDYCMLRYSNKSIIGTASNEPNFYIYPIVNASSVDEFNQKLSSLFESLRADAAGGGSQRKFATGNTTGLGFENIYALVQCTPDLSEGQCSDCLTGISRYIPSCCNGKIAVSAGAPSCIFRYDTNRFFNETPADVTPPSAPPGNDDNTARTVIIIVVPAVSLIIITICFFIFLRKRKRKIKPPQDTETEEEISAVESLQYGFDTIQVATDNFSHVNKLGQGGFGAVYMGRLPNGQKIAVKRLSRNSRQGELEFKNEVTLVAKLQHRNLVRLLGFCLEGVERLLIYEFVPNSSLDHFIFEPVKRAHLGWERRYKIIGGVARGLLYLHEDSRLRIIHRDLKASNVLLDEDMNPKISDFGMARLFMLDETHGSTSRIVGTYGYMAPEYAMHGQFSVKSDVFSFGVLVLEIVSGQKNNCFRNGENVEDLLSYAWKNWGKETVPNLIDPTLKAAGSSSMREMMRCIHIGLLCVQENVVDRPTMALVVLMLNSFSITLPVPLEPAFFMHSSTDPELPLLQNHDSSQSKSKSACISENEDSVTDLYPR